MIKIIDKKFESNELQLFNTLIDFSQPQLLKFLKTYLEKCYDETYSNTKYVIAVGEIPVALVAHLDTVHYPTVLKKELYYDTTQGVIWSPQGLGADDRAGVYGILKILEAGYRPTVIFTTDEEIGGQGAQAVINDFENPITELKYIIELDRRGATDCVFYDCNNHHFKQYIEKFGFITQWGTYSDISEICPKWKIAGVNLSIGYENEHSKAELLRISWLKNTINKVKKMLDDIANAEYYIYIHSTKYTWYTGGGWDSDYDYCESLGKANYSCYSCKKIFSEPDVVKIKKPNGHFVYSCIDCLDGGVEFCDVCQELYFVDDKYITPRGVCPHCYKEIKKEGSSSGSRNKKAV